MKQLFTLSAILLVLTLFCTVAKAQNEKRYSIEMTFTHKGKIIITPLASASYSLNRDVYDSDSLYPSKKYIYYSVVPLKLDKDLLSAIKDKKASYDIQITMTDTYGKEPKKETLLKKASVSAISESYSPYNYDYAGSVNLSLMAESIVIEGVEIEP
ncbi:MAG TPA: hypothetical protein PKE30_07155 [Niabella sp.]|mgnify:CR=1 FL=1|nr:hypothetical protein [Niabella sp.]